MRRIAMSMSWGSTASRKCMRAYASLMRIIDSRCRTATGIACVMPASFRSSVYTCRRAFLGRGLERAFPQVGYMHAQWSQSNGRCSDSRATSRPLASMLVRATCAEVPRKA